MKKIKFFYVFLTILAFTINACVKDASDLSITKFKTQLAVQSFISPQDSIINVYVSKTKRIFGVPSEGYYEFRPVKDATVVLSDGINSVNLSYDSQNKRYSVSASVFPVESGKTYYLDVSTPDNYSASANCTVPQINSSLEIISYDNEEHNLSVYLKFKDTPNQTDFYRIDGTVFVQEDDTSYFLPPYKKNTYSQEYIVLSDVNIDSDTMYSSLYFRYYLATASFFEIYLLTTDENYYKYIKSVKSQLQAHEEDEELSGDSFLYNLFTEPVMLYNNISGGIGIFAAYNKYKIVKHI